MQEEPRDLDIRLTKLEDEIRSLRKEIRRMDQSRYLVPHTSICVLCVLCVVFPIPISICAMCMVRGTAHEGGELGGSICSICSICAAAPGNDQEE